MPYRRQKVIYYIILLESSSYEVLIFPASYLSFFADFIYRLLHRAYSQTLPAVRAYFFFYPYAHFSDNVTDLSGLMAPCFSSSRRWYFEGAAAAACLRRMPLCYAVTYIWCIKVFITAGTQAPQTGFSAVYIYATGNITFIIWLPCRILALRNAQRIAVGSK